MNAELDVKGATTIDGNLRVGSGAEFTVFPRAGNHLTVHGDVVADQCKVVQIAAPTKVDGNEELWCGRADVMAVL